ncbi:MAG: hypothetical protein ACRDH9_11100 [Actinomycetota bacterium]
MRLMLGYLLAASLASPAAAAESDTVQIPAPRIGDAWTIDAEGMSWDLRATEMGTAVDRLGREREAMIVDVEGPHPISGELKEVTRHTIAVDASSGVSIADLTAWEFSGDSEPGAYSSYEPNNPDGWPGWVIGGGLLTGRELAVGDTVEVTFVMTSTRGADTLALQVEEAEPGPWGRCVRASGRIHYPTWITWTGGEYHRRSLDVAVDTLVCEGSPYAIETELSSESGDLAWAAGTELVSFEAGQGEPAVMPGQYSEPARHAVGATAPFDGALRDGGPLPIWSLEGAQETAAELAPGLLAWRAANPDGYLVEAEYTRPEDEAGAVAGVGAEQWRLVFAAPSGSQHAVLAQLRLGVATAVDLPQGQAYPATVPPLASHPDEVMTAAGAIAAWRQHSGSSAVPTGLRWTPLHNDRWFVLGEVRGLCTEDGCQATIGMEMPFRYDSGAAETGEHPVPQAGAVAS